jgi:hypothetical protein
VSGPEFKLQCHQKKKEREREKRKEEYWQNIIAGLVVEETAHFMADRKHEVGQGGPKGQGQDIVPKGTLPRTHSFQLGPTS